MPVNFKLNRLFSDRVGIVADISARVAPSGLSIFSTEVARRNDKKDVSIGIAPGTHRPNREEMAGRSGRIADLVGIRSVNALPYEKREHRLRVMLDNTSDGVIAINWNVLLPRKPQEILGWCELPGFSDRAFAVSLFAFQPINTLRKGENP